MSYECLCGEIIDQDFPVEYEFDRDDAVFRSIVEGEVLRLECPHCGAVHRLEEESLFRSRDRSLVLKLLPEHFRDQVRAGNYPPDPEITRLVVGYPELVEKVLLWRDGFDDRIIEYLKYGFYIRNTAKLTLTYAGVENGKLEFWVREPDTDKVGRTRVPLEAYREASGHLEEILSRPRLRAYLQAPRVFVGDGPWFDPSS